LAAVETQVEQTTSSRLDLAKKYIVIRSILILLFVCVWTGFLRADDLPQGVVNTQNANDVSLTPAESLKRIKVPDGFSVTLFAGEPAIRRPIAFDFDDRGRLWVVENYSHPKWNADNKTDRIVILEDSNHDGEFDKRTIFWDKGRYLTGIAFGHGGVWIANTPELSFIPDKNGDDSPDSEPVVMLDGFGISSNNVINNLHWGPDGWLYGAIGLSSASQVGQPGSTKDDKTRITRGIWRFHPVTHKFEKVAEGMVNPWGADFNEYGDLITSNTVIAHLWHIVPGMYCQRRANEGDYRYAYGRIQTIANHLHWGGGQWQASRQNEQRHSVAGGGHAHCGGMVYLGDNWPDKYRGTFFSNNLHGNRVNNDRLLPHGSSYAGVHNDDFLFGNDPWFRGMSIKYGSDGGVYISDWHDYGECHDSDGSHRTTGRIYKVVYGKPNVKSVDLSKLSNVALAKLHTHKNEWHVRHARRLLHERAANGIDVAEAAQTLWKLLKNESDERNKLRVLFTLFVTNNLDEHELLALLDHQSQHVRRWIVRFLVDQKIPTQETLKQIAHVALQEQSAKVRLAIAVALQRIEVKDRSKIAAALLTHAEDANDHYIPLMTWYGIESIANSSPDDLFRLAETSKIPLIRRFVARRAIDHNRRAIASVIRQTQKASSELARLDYLQGTLDAIGDRGKETPPPEWADLYKQVSTSSNPLLRSTAVQLATIFGDKLAIAKLRLAILDEGISPTKRQESLQALLKVENGVNTELLHGLTKSKSSVRQNAIQALSLRSDSSTPGVLLAAYKTLTATEQQDAIAVFTTQLSFASNLLTAVENKKLEKQDVSAFALQQLRAFDDKRLNKRIDALWANDSKKLKKSDEITRYKKLLTPDFLKTGNAAHGRIIFQKNCAKCHTLFGSGANIAPDLTGSGRKKLDYVLSNLVDPSAIIDPAYRLTLVITSKGKLLSGFMVHQDDRAVVLRTQQAQIKLQMKDIDELKTLAVSMMPENMLNNYTPEQVRDLVLYLSSETQVPLPFE
jgi:putative membrane-bound dehydrogenase-like protein